ncbi:MAG TPA: methyltransferase regulatory domain-containing protein [Gemmataceae bacterium]|nr:methyltransferase regulatory domain-containing protein [Gemmataceae bacterium]
MSGAAITSYDEIPYPRYSFPQTHPERLAVVAMLLGLTPPPLERCRVLELGCAGGGNLIPMAEDLPQAHFLGIDLSQRQIAEGQRWIAEFGLTNIELRHQSILDFDDAEKFDYIICHGVYSWVSPEVQDRILALCRKHLHPKGIAFVSWNSLPGWHMRGMIRDMMIYHGRRFTDPRQQVGQARALLDFLVSSVKMDQNPYGQFLRSELEQLRQQPDAYLAHEHLEEHNAPIYLHQFVERAATHNLRYLADTNLWTMEFGQFPTEVGQVLNRLTTDLIQLQQYIDFLKNRTFSQTLLIHIPQQPNYNAVPALVKNFLIAAPLRPDSASPNLQSSDFERFQTPSGASASSRYPIVKSALMVLAEQWPQALPFDEVRVRARAKLSDRPAHDPATIGEDEFRLGEAFLKFFTSVGGLMEFRLLPLRLTAQSGPQPLARPLARWQANSGLQVTNLRHELVTLNEFGRQLLLRLDGKHSLPALVQQMMEMVRNGTFTFQQNGETVTDWHQAEPLLVQAVQQHIDLFARQSLFLA